MQKLVVFLWLISMCGVASAGEMADEARRRAKWIETSILPKLNTIRSEPDLSKKLDTLLHEMPQVEGAVKGNNFGYLSGEKAKADVRRLRKTLESLRSLVNRQELNKAQFEDAKFSVNGIVDYMIRSSKISVSEVMDDAAYSEYWEQGEKNAREGKSTAWQTVGEFGVLFKQLLYSGRISYWHSVPSIFQVGKYNMSITRIEGIVKRGNGAPGAPAPLHGTADAAR